MADQTVMDEVIGAVIVPPDGGWGWVIVAASFFCNCIVDGIIFTAGQAFQPEWENEFNCSTSTASWVVSLLCGMYLIAGPVVSVIVNIIGARKTVIVGTLIAALGFGLSVFAPSIAMLYLTFGVLGGIGFGLIFLPSVVVVGYYFEKKRALATGIAVCGSGIGTFLFAPFLQYLLVEYHWRQVMLILTGIILNCLVFGSLFRPLEPTKKQIEHFVADNKLLLDRMNDMKLAEVELSSESLRQKLSESNRNQLISGDRPMSLTNLTLTKRGHNTSLFLIPEEADKLTARAISRDSLVRLNRPLSRQDIFFGGSVRNLKEFQSQPTVAHYVASTINLDIVETEEVAIAVGSVGFLTTLRSILDLSILKSPSFLIFAINGFLTLTGFFVPFIYLPLQAQSVGVSQERATFLVSILGIVNIIARVLCGFLSDHPRMNALMINNVALVLAGLATIFVPLMDSFGLLVFYCVVFGFGTACFASLRSIICVELLGLQKLTNAFGMCLLFMGAAALIGSPIAGFLKDLTHSYNMSFYVTGALVMLSGLLGIPLRWVNSWEKGKNDKGRPKSKDSATPNDPVPLVKIAEETVAE